MYQGGRILYPLRVATILVTVVPIRLKIISTVDHTLVWGRNSNKKGGDKITQIEFLGKGGDKIKKNETRVNPGKL